MNHIVYSPKDKTVVIFDDVENTIVEAQAEFLMAMRGFMTSDIIQTGWLRTKIREIWCAVMFKLGKPQPEFFSQCIMLDPRSGNKYRLVMEIIPGGAVG